MTDVLLADRSPAELHPSPALIEPGPRRHRGRWMVLVAAITLAAVALGTLLLDAAHVNQRYDHDRHVLAVTRGTTSTVLRELRVARVDLRLVTQQVGNDRTALAQDTSQLEGARSALSAAQAHVVQQASLLNSLHGCLGGVEQALNALAVGNQAKAADALTWVAAPCSTAVDASG